MEKPWTDTWLVIGIMLVLLMLAAALIYVGWGSRESDSPAVTTFASWWAMALGLIVTFAVGTGLLSLVYSSNRRRR